MVSRGSRADGRRSAPRGHSPEVHVHDHDGAHLLQEDADERLTHYRTLEIAVRELLIEKGILTAEEIRIAVERIEATTPAQGARLVARAWMDSSFKKRLLRNPTLAAEEMGIKAGPIQLAVVENTRDRHHLVVCTLCSCYPRMLLGPPPDWYKSRNYRSRAVREPRDVLSEFGTEIRPEVEVRVLDSTADLRYLVLPMRPSGTRGWTEDRLATLITRDCLVGVTQPTVPSE